MAGTKRSTLSDLLREKTHTRGLKRFQIAILVNLSPSYFGRIFAGKQRPPYWTIARICDFFGITAAEFDRRFKASRQERLARKGACV